MSRDDGLAIGDRICLFSENGGFVSMVKNSLVYNEPFVFSDQNVRMPTNVPHMESLVFEICICSRYKTEKMYRKALQAQTGQPEFTSHLRLKKMKEAVDLEATDNAQEMKRNIGRKLRYGETIQLRHVFSGKYMHADPHSLSVTDKSNMKTRLLPFNGRGAQFIVMPKYKVNAEGEPVQSEKFISLESVKLRNHFLHCGGPLPRHELKGERIHELSVSLEKSGFIVMKSASFSTDCDKIQGLDFVQMFHQDIGALLVAEGNMNGQCLEDEDEDVHLRMRAVDPMRPKTLLPSTNPNTFWQIEKERLPYDGSDLLWIDQIRFRHAATNLYLCMTEEGALGLTKNMVDPRTVFRMFPVAKTNHSATSDSSARIENVISGRWIQGLEDEAYQKRSMSAVQTDEMKSIIWDNARCRKVVLSDNRRYDDAFKLTLVKQELVSDFYFVAGVVPVCCELMDWCEGKVEIPLKEFYKIIQTIHELKEFLMRDSEPVKYRQKLLRSSRVLNFLLRVLEVPTTEDVSCEHIRRLKVEIYHVLYNYLSGPSTKNNLFAARYFDLIHGQITQSNDIGAAAVVTLTQLIKGIRTIVDRIKTHHIRDVIEYLKSTHTIYMDHEPKNYLHLILMSEFCVCDGQALAGNQVYITRNWLKEEKDGLFLITRGQYIDRIRNVLYISSDNGKCWLPLHVFVDSKQPRYSEIQCKFLSHQLDLYVALCKGRNEECIKLITKELELINWEEAFLCLQADIMPDYMRAKFCEVIIGLFVDVGNNYSVVEHCITAFDYDSVGSSQRADPFAIKDLSVIFPVLRDWIFRFLTDNRVMVSVDPEKNVLLSNVFHLLSFLVKFGYFDDSYPILDMIAPIMNVLDGRIDEPFRREVDPHGEDVPLTDQQMALLGHYRDGVRYRATTEHHRVVQAKTAGLEVLELIMEMQVTDRIKAFTESFKLCVEKNPDRADLDDAIDSNFDPYSLGRLDMARQKAMQATVNQVFDRSKYFDVDQMQQVLLDLTLYEYDGLLQKAVSVLCRYFYSKGSVFRKIREGYFACCPASQALHVRLSREVPNLIVYIDSKWDEFSLRKVTEILTTFRETCDIKGSDVTHQVNKRILINHNAVDAMLRVFECYSDPTIVSPIADEFYRETLVTLRVLARSMDSVKNHLMDRFDFLFSIRRALPHMIDLFCEIFEGRVDLCERIGKHELVVIFELMALQREKLPQIFVLLAKICKVHETNTIVSKNVRLVVQYLMRNYRIISKVFEMGEEARTQMLVAPGGSDRRSYYLGYLHLLAISAELNDDFIESFCRSLVPMQEVVRVLMHDNLSHFAKRTFVKFLSEVYLETKLSTDVTGVADFTIHDIFWDYIQKEIGYVERFTRVIQKVEPKQLYIMMKHLIRQNVRDNDSVDTQLAHFIDAAVPMLTNAFEYVLSAKVIDDEKFAIIVALTGKVNGVLELLAPFCAIHYQLEVISNYLFAGLKSGFLQGSIMAPILHGLGSYVREDRHPEAPVLTAFEREYSMEMKMNEDFQRFVTNCRSLYEGHNSCESQLCVGKSKMDRSSRKKPFCPEDTVECLPLGREFQELCMTFIDLKESDPKRRFCNLRVLIRQMKVSSTLVFSRDKDKIAQDQLNVRCMQVLRGLIHNEIMALPADWSDSINDKHVIRQLRLIRSIQTEVCSYDFQRSVMPHMRNPLSETCKQIMACEKVMLFNASRHVQDDLFNFVCGTTTEIFFFALKNIFNTCVEAVRKMKGHYEKKIQTTAREGERRKSLAVSPEVSGAFEYKEVLEVFAEKAHRMTAHVGSQATGCKTVMEDGYTLVTLEMVAGMCDGQCSPLQDYLRIQSDNPKSYNIVSEICTLVSALYYNVNGDSCGLLTQLFDTLNEICAGNQENRVALLDSKIVDYINYILRTPEFPLCSPEEILALKDTIASVLISLTEESDPAAKTLAQNVFILLDMESFYNSLSLFYQLSKKDSRLELDSLVQLRPEPEEVVGCGPRCSEFCLNRLCAGCRVSKETKEMRAEVYEIGFKYYQVLARYKDVVPHTDKRLKQIVTPAHEEAFRAFEKGGMSIELVKNGSLQRTYFRVKNKSIVREEIKERIIWEVDRSSSSSKLRDFLVWADSIVLDIAYSRRVLANPFAKVFTKLWYIWLYVTLGLSVVISIMCLLTFKAQHSLADGWDPQKIALMGPLIQPKYAYLRPYMRILACVHTGFCGCQLISFLIANHPSLGNVRSFGLWLLALWRALPFHRWRCGRVRKRRPGTEGEESDAEESGGREATESLSTDADKPSGPVLRDEFDKLPVTNKLEVHLISGVSLYYVISFALSLVGTAWVWFHPVGYYCFAFHLLNIVVSNQILVGVIRAIVDSAVTLMWVGSLILIFFFFFSIFGFSFLRVSMDPGNGAFYCDTLGRCFITLLRQGMVFDLWIDNFMPHRSDMGTFEQSIPNSVFTLAVYIVIFIIMLNVIMGIIVDKFAELRNRKWSTEQDMRETCFICGRSSYEFETKAKGFRHHVVKEQSMWAYLFFFIYLNDTKLNDYSALALYVYRLLRQRRYDFFPMDRAMSLSVAEEDTESALLGEADSYVKTMLQLYETKDFERKQYREQLRQQRWHEENSATVRYAKRPHRPSVEEFSPLSDANL